MDAVDVVMIETLRSNGRIRGRELAEILGISRSAAAARLAQLLQSGKVRVVGVVHPAVLGLHAVAHVSVTVDRAVEDVAGRIAELDEVPFVSLVTGSAALVAEVRVHQTAELAASLEKIRTTTGVKGISTLVYTDMVIDVLRPWATSENSLDETDVRLLGLLQLDGRMSYTEMSARTGLSIGTARLRVRRLIADQVIRVGALTAPGTGEQEYAIGLGIQMRGVVADLVALLADLPEMTFLATTIGRFDILATVTCASLSEGIAAVDRIRELPQAVGLETWLHMHVFKERYHFSPLTPGYQPVELDGVPVGSGS
ncbi:DNA-binding Lrp family transcriptional regulator [Nakamurella sp. UYEF19]|uniref:Lrp/AsnC family transcriptional regulator n=1 Tax=Nakamurella sp. UYEF19 TaxID=1756392 RepID=UPI003396CEA0